MAYWNREIQINLPWKQMLVNYTRYEMEEKDVRNRRYSLAYQANSNLIIAIFTEMYTVL